MEHSKIENIDIEKNKELFEYEMTEVILQLKGEFAVISGSNMRYADVAVEDERLKVTPKSLPKVAIDVKKTNVPQIANLEIQEITPIRITLPKSSIPQTKVVQTQEIVMPEVTLQKSTSLPEIPPNYYFQGMKVVLGDGINIELPLIPDITTVELQPGYHIIAPIHYSEVANVKILVKPNTLPAVSVVLPSLTASALEALDESKGSSKFHISISLVPTYSVGSWKYQSVLQKASHMRIPTSITFGVEKREIIISTPITEYGIGLNNWQPICIRPSLPHIGVMTRDIPPITIKQVSLNQKAMCLPDAKMNLPVADSWNVKREDFASKEITMPAIPPIKIKKFESSMSVEKKPIPMVNTALPKEVATLESYFKQGDSQNKEESEGTIPDEVQN